MDCVWIWQSPVTELVVSKNQFLAWISMDKIQRISYEIVLIWCRLLDVSKICPCARFCDAMLFMAVAKIFLVFVDYQRRGSLWAVGERAQEPNFPFSSRVRTSLGYLAVQSQSFVPLWGWIMNYWGCTSNALQIAHWDCLSKVPFNPKHSVTVRSMNWKWDMCLSVICQTYLLLVISIYLLTELSP